MLREDRTVGVLAIARAGGKFSARHIELDPLWSRLAPTPERSYNGRINVIIARRVPSLAEAVTRTLSLGDARGCALCSRERASEM
jgi:hypothetical protein